MQPTRLEGWVRHNVAIGDIWICAMDDPQHSEIVHFKVVGIGQVPVPDQQDSVLAIEVRYFVSEEAEDRQVDELIQEVGINEGMLQNHLSVDTWTELVKGGRLRRLMGIGTDPLPPS